MWFEDPTHYDGRGAGAGTWGRRETIQITRRLSPSASGHPPPTPIHLRHLRKAPGLSYSSPRWWNTSFTSDPAWATGAYNSGTHGALAKRPIRRQKAATQHTAQHQPPLHPTLINSRPNVDSFQSWPSTQRHLDQILPSNAFGAFCETPTKLPALNKLSTTPQPRSLAAYHYHNNICSRWTFFTANSDNPSSSLLCSLCPRAPVTTCSPHLWFGAQTKHAEPRGQRDAVCGARTEHGGAVVVFCVEQRCCCCCVRGASWSSNPLLGRQRHSKQQQRRQHPQQQQRAPLCEPSGLWKDAMGVDAATGARAGSNDLAATVFGGEQGCLVAMARVPCWFQKQQLSLAQHLPLVRTHHQQGHKINPCNSMLHPAAEAGIEPEGTELAVQVLGWPFENRWGVVNLSQAVMAAVILQRWNALTLDLRLAYAATIIRSSLAATVGAPHHHPWPPPPNHFTNPTRSLTPRTAPAGAVARPLKGAWSCAAFG